MNPDDRILVAVTCPVATRNNPESGFLRLFRNRALHLKSSFRFHATRGTAFALQRTGFYSTRDVKDLRSGDTGGMIEIANLAVSSSCSAVVFLYDPAELHSESPEARALIRVCIEKKIPLLTTVETATHWLVRPRELISKELERLLKDHPRVQPLQPIPVDRTGDQLLLPIAELGNRGAHIAVRRFQDIHHSTIALIAHDRRKSDMMDFAVAHRDWLSAWGRVLATGTTGTQLLGSVMAVSRAEQVDLQTILPKLQLAESGPAGGDIQIAHEVLERRCQAVVFFQDPESAHAHEADIALLRRACQLPDVRCVLISNREAANKWALSLYDGLPGVQQTVPGRLRHHIPYMKEVISVDDPRVAKVNKALGTWEGDHCRDDGWLKDPDHENAKQSWARHERCWRLISHALVRAGVPYFDTLVRNCAADDRIVAISSGQLFGWFTGDVKWYLEKVMRPDKSSSCRLLRIVSASGDWADMSSSADDHATELAEHYTTYAQGGAFGGKIDVFLWRQQVFSGRTPAVLNEPMPHVALITVAGLPQGDARLKHLEFVNAYRDAGPEGKKLLTYVVEKGAVAVVGGVFLDAEGREVALTDLRTRGNKPLKLAGLGYSDLCKITERGRVILIAGGDKRRIPGILAAIYAKICNVVVADERTIEGVISLHVSKAPKYDSTTQTFGFDQSRQA